MSKQSIVLSSTACILLAFVNPYIEQVYIRMTPYDFEIGEFKKWSVEGDKCVHNKRADNAEGVLEQCKNIFQQVEKNKLTWGDLIDPGPWTYLDNKDEADRVMKDVDNCNNGNNNKININSNRLSASDVEQNIKDNCTKNTLNGNDIKFNVDHPYHYGEIILEK